MVDVSADEALRSAYRVERFGSSAREAVGHGCQLPFTKSHCFFAAWAVSLSSPPP
jgi:hypothetical protein